MAEGLGPEGRNRYILTRFTMDIPWPLVYGVTLSLWMATLSSRLPKFSWAISLPALGVAFDLVENIMAVAGMATYPSSLSLLIWMGAIATAVKWALLGLTFALLFTLTPYVLGRWIWKRVTSTHRP